MTKISQSKHVYNCLTFLFLITSCVSIKKPDKRIANAGSSTFQIAPLKKPFKYGYAYSKKECEEFRPVMNYYEIRKGDAVADIGAANGWLEGVFSVMCDSVKFFIQDIDTKRLKQFNKVNEYYSSIRSTPQTNSFSLVVGSEKRTELPDGLFDKIIIHNTFHELSDIENIVKDLAKKLKPNGKIFVSDQFSNSYRRIRHKGCGLSAENTAFVVDRFSFSDLYLTGMAEPENSFENYLRFEFDKKKSSEFHQKKSEFEVSIQELDKLNMTEVNSDSVAIKEIIRKINPHLKKIQNTYPLIERYLNSLGYLLLKDMQIQSAIHVLKANITLFPESANAYDSLGEAYLKEKDYGLSLKNYKKSLQLNPDNKNAEKKIAEITQTISKRP